MSELSDIILLDKQKLIKQHKKMVYKADEIIVNLLQTKMNNLHKRNCKYKCCGQHKFKRIKKCWRCGMTEELQLDHDRGLWVIMGEIYEDDKQINALVNYINKEQGKLYKLLHDKSIYEYNTDMEWGDC